LERAETVNYLLHIVHLCTDPNKTEMVEYLCRQPLVNDELVCAKYSKGITALHLACNFKRLQLHSTYLSFV